MHFEKTIPDKYLQSGLSTEIYICRHEIACTPDYEHLHAIVNFREWSLIGGCCNPALTGWLLRS